MILTGFIKESWYYKNLQTYSLYSPFMTNVFTLNVISFYIQSLQFNIFSCVTTNRQERFQEEKGGLSLPVCPTLLLILQCLDQFGCCLGVFNVVWPQKKQLTRAPLTLESLSVLNLSQTSNATVVVQYGFNIHKICAFAIDLQPCKAQQNNCIQIIVTCLL